MAFLTMKTLSGPVQAWYDKNLLASSIANNIYSVAATKKRLPAGNSDTLRMRRRNRIAVNKAPLSVDGNRIAPSTYTNTDIDAKVQWYGQWVGINEQVQITSQDPVLNGASAELAITMRQLEDELVRDMLMSAAASVNCIGGGNGDNPSNMTRRSFSQAAQRLISADAFTTLEGMEGVNKVGSGPIPNSFFALAHSDLYTDFTTGGMVGWWATHTYPNPSKALPSEIGSIDKFRVLTSTNGAVRRNSSANGRDVYVISCVGMDAYAKVELDANSAKFIYKGPEYSDELMQNASAGFKIAFCPKILNESWIVNLNTTLAL